MIGEGEESEQKSEEAFPYDQVKKQGIHEPQSKENSNNPGKSKSFFRFLIEILITIAIAFCLAIIIQSFFLKAFVIPSSSMTPTLKVGDRVMVEKLSYLFGKPRRGEIVVFRFPPSEPSSMNTKNPFYWPFEQIAETLHIAFRDSTPYVKRVVATGGQTIELRKGILYVNGKRIHEGYAMIDSCDYGPERVPEGTVFCLGDYRANSRDSRFIGPVPLRTIIGRVILIWWPPGRFRAPR
ncbi:MAG: signal peptidase I [Actinomycetota bacterium]|nr:signal peptidase I [Actinomycetota bacterium]